MVVIRLRRVAISIIIVRLGPVLDVHNQASNTIVFMFLVLVDFAVTIGFEFVFVEFEPPPGKASASRQLYISTVSYALCPRSSVSSAGRILTSRWGPLSSCHLYLRALVLVRSLAFSPSVLLLLLHDTSSTRWPARQGLQSERERERVHE